MQRQSLKMKRTIYGHDMNHREIATTLANMGNICQVLGKLNEVETIQSECLKMYGSIYRHDVRISLFSLGILLYRVEKVEDGLSMVEDAVRMFYDVFGASSEHPHIVKVENFLQAHRNAACEEAE